jgi:hypothetical protein
MAARGRSTALEPKAPGSETKRRASWPDLEDADTYRRVIAFCDRLRSGRLSEKDLDHLVAADAAIRGLTHTRDLAQRRATAVALVRRALPRLTSVQHLDELLGQLAAKVDPRFASIRVPRRGRDGAKRRRPAEPHGHLARDLETITQPRWGAIRVTAWLALRSGALTGRADRKPRTLEFVMPQIYADELAEREAREARTRAPKQGGRRRVNKPARRRR